ncbi:MAG: malate:quinone oxidoreductase [Crocinitomicaceae bacterium]|nr:malate:quinone oxidoreductase [Crocinitomicaceae bacterium]MDG1658193.1 malate:quinone oxidoreductase [Crocinitomicaceae bacterium]
MKKIMSGQQIKDDQEFNVVLIGAGIVSATLGVFIKKLIPFAKIH